MQHPVNIGFQVVGKKEVVQGQRRIEGGTSNPCKGGVYRPMQHLGPLHEAHLLLPQLSIPFICLSLQGRQGGRSLGEECGGRDSVLQHGTSIFCALVTRLQYNPSLYVPNPFPSSLLPLS